MALGPLLVLLLVTTLLGALGATSTAASTVGYVGPSYAGTTAPTGQKPQSKLWFAHDTWWGVMWDPTSKDFHVFKYSWAANAWSDTGVLVDERANSYVDVLWTGSELYVASAGTDAASAGHAPRLTKYQYVATSGSWSRVGGYPISLGSGGVEAVVIDQDSAGVVWATYTQGSRVWVTHGTSSSNTAFVPRFQVPAPTAAGQVDPDDISAIVAYDGDKIGVLWSNERTEVMYWASHTDGTPDSSWTTMEAYKQPEGADDHINLRSVVGDSSGRVFAAVKTSMDKPTDPLINLLVLKANGTWATHMVSTKADDLTRAILVLDPARRDLYVFSAGPCCSGGKVYVKKTSLDAPSFTPGLGQVFISSDANPKANNPTSTKQNVTAASGLMVMAGDDGTRRYLYNRVEIAPPPADLDPPETTITSAPGPTTTDAGASFSFASDEGGAQFRCALDGATPEACTSPTSYTGLAAGAHAFEVAAVDAAGNVDATPARHEWVVEDAPPPPPPPPPSSLFADDFSSGDFAAGGWTVTTGGDGTATVVPGAVADGDPGARLVSTTATGSTASIRAALPAAEPEVRLDLDLRLGNAGRVDQSYALVKLYDDAGTRMLSLSRDGATGRLSVVGRTTTSAAFVGPAVGAPAHLQLRAVQRADGLDTVDVLLDGVSVFSSAEVDMGQLGVRRLRLGDDSLRRHMDLRVDSVEVRQ